MAWSVVVFRESINCPVFWLESKSKRRERRELLRMQVAFWAEFSWKKKKNELNKPVNQWTGGPDISALTKCPFFFLLSVYTLVTLVILAFSLSLFTFFLFLQFVHFFLVKLKHFCLNHQVLVIFQKRAIQLQNKEERERGREESEIAH